MKNRLMLKIIMVPLLFVFTFTSAHAHVGEKDFGLFTSLFHDIAHAFSNGWLVYGVTPVVLLGVISWVAARRRVAS